MARHVRNTVALAGMLGLPCGLLAQTQPAPVAIIACEGPNMPAICPPPSGAPRSLATERLELARREGLDALQAQKMMSQRQSLVRGVTPTIRPTAAPAYSTFQPNPYAAPLAPPDFKAAAQVVGNLISGGPHN